jgi:5'-nucleotidase
MSLRVLATCALVACTPVPVPVPAPAPAPVSPAAAPHAVTISLVGTNDLHGAIDRLPLFAGYIANLRAARAADGGAVVLVDAGDMFQGTLESNLGEGADVVRAYNQLGYAAATLGNHEFDYGPVGSAATAQTFADDPRGALEARAHEAKFPFVTSNIDDSLTHARMDYANMPASTMVTAAGVHIGIIGAATASTPYTTMPANFTGLAIAPTAARIADEARVLRASSPATSAASARTSSTTRIRRRARATRRSCRSSTRCRRARSMCSSPGTPTRAWRSGSTASRSSSRSRKAARSAASISTSARTATSPRRTSTRRS